MKRSVDFAAVLVVMLAVFIPGTNVHAQGHRNVSGEHAPGPGGSGFYTEDFGSDGYHDSGGFYSGGGYDGNCGGCSECGGGGCSECEDGCDTGYGSSWWDYCGLCGGAPRWYFIAEYLNVRASFSEALAYIDQNIQNPADLTDDFRELNFQHESSVRFGGGIKLGCCDEEIRFLFTRMESNADAVAPVGSLVAYETTSPDGPTFINADVDTKSFDADYRKTIPLGGTQCCGCGDACGECCDPCCAPACPAWDITWSGGLRFSDVNWNRHYLAVDDDGDFFRESNSSLSFDGGGPRIGLEGRRYFGQRHWCSAYLKGDISVLLGQMQQQITRLDEDDTFTTQTARGRRIIPVTEIEAGFSAHLTGSSLLSTGYLFSAWHDLGFRDQFNFVTQLESNYDDANILGFDGFFVRLEVGY